MDNLINRLIDVDKQARRRVAAAKKERAGVVDSLEGTKQALLEENEAKYQAFVNEETARCDAVLAEARAKEAQMQADRLARLDAVAAENHARWVDEIVAAVIR